MGAALSHPPPAGAPRTGPVRGRLRSRPHGTTQGPPPAVTATWGARGVLVWGAQPGDTGHGQPPSGAGSGRVRTLVVAAAEQVRAVCRPAAGLAARRLSIRALVNRQRTEGTAAAGLYPGLSPTRGVPREHRGAAGAHAAWVAAPDPGAAHAAPAHCATCLWAVPAARISPPLAGAKECKQSCWCRRDSGRHRGYLLPCSRCRGELRVPPVPPRLGTRPAEEPGPPVPLVSAAAGSWPGTVPGRAMAPAGSSVGSSPAAGGQGYATGQGRIGGLSPTAVAERMGDAAETLTDAFRKLKTRSVPFAPSPDCPEAGDKGVVPGQSRTGLEAARGYPLQGSGLCNWGNWEGP